MVGAVQETSSGVAFASSRADKLRAGSPGNLIDVGDVGQFERGNVDEFERARGQFRRSLVNRRALSADIDTVRATSADFAEVRRWSAVAF